MSGVRLALALLVGVLALAVLAVFASAALDRPSKTVVDEVTVDASAATVWGILTDFERYGDWNPVVTSISGERRLGAELDLALQRPGADVEELHPEIVIWRPKRKLRHPGPNPNGSPSRRQRRRRSTSSRRRRKRRRRFRSFASMRDRARSCRRQRAHNLRARIFRPTAVHAHGAR